MTPQSARRRRSLPFSEWPVRDQEAWQSAVRRAGPLDEGGPASHFSAATLRTMQELFGGLLGWLNENGELDLAAGPEDRLTRERFARYATARRSSVSDNVVFNNIRMLVMTLNCLAPGHDWSWMRKHPNGPTKLEAAAARKPVRVIEPGRLLAGLLLRLDGLRLAETNEENAIKARNLLIVALAVCTALRLRNLMGLTLGCSFFRHGGGFEIRYATAALKNKRQATIRLMPELTPYVELYMDVLRPLLLRSAKPDARNALWLSTRGRRISDSYAEAIFKQVTTEVQGWAANPQSFRHSAVTELLERDPRAIGVASALLAHRDPVTTSSFYDLSMDRAARKHWSKLVDRYRRRRSR